MSKKKTPGNNVTLNFGTIAIKLGFCTLEQIDECLRLQERMKDLGVAPKKLGEILLAKGYLDNEQIRRIFQYQGQQGGHTQIAGYKILTKIGAGAMGSIYKALQISMDRMVAIKVLSPKYAQHEPSRERFLREARAVAKLNHPNIIQGIDVGESNGIHYFAMEFIDGPSIGELLRRGGTMDEGRSLQIVAQIAKALEHAYNHGIIHRDVKPDNVMLTRDGTIKVCDLGLAKMVMNDDPQEPRPGVSMGTPYYISPEQARGDRDVDTRSDIYSLGATLYHMLVGEVPFPGETAPAVISRHLTEPITPLRERNSSVSAEAEFITTKMMQKAREDRYQNMREVVADIEAMDRKEPPAGFPQASGTRPKRPPRLRRSRRLRNMRRLRRR